MKISLRPVRRDDDEMLLSWKNEEDTRKNSIVSDAKIDIVSHARWFAAAMERVAAGKTSFSIILLDGRAVGDVRVEHEDGNEISIRMDPKYRGMGIATQVIALFDGPLTAKIRTHNVASMRCFIANGFRPVSHTGGDAPYLTFKK